MDKTEQIRVAAYKNEPLCEQQKWTLADRLLWCEYRELYRKYERGAIRKEDAEKERNRIVRQYDANVAEQEMNDRVYDAQAKLWKRIEAAACAYRKDRTLENADAFIDAVYNVQFKKGDAGL